MTVSRAHGRNDRRQIEVESATQVGADDNELLYDRTIYFGPKPPAGKESNWIQTVPGKGWWVVLRLYGPLEPWFDKTWRPGEVEQAVGGVDVDLGAGAAHMPVDDVPEHREQVAHQRLLARGLALSADGLRLPERGVDGVVFAALRRLPLVGEAVR